MWDTSDVAPPFFCESIWLLVLADNIEAICLACRDTLILELAISHHVCCGHGCTNCAVLQCEKSVNIVDGFIHRSNYNYNVKIYTTFLGKKLMHGYCRLAAKGHSHARWYIYCKNPFLMYCQTFMND